MLTLWSDFDRSFDSLDGMLRRFDRLFEQGLPRGVVGHDRTTRFVETDNEVVLTADLPGVKPEDVDVNLHDGVLSIQAIRRTDVPEGYDARRIERPELKLARTFSLPAPVDPERTSASLRDGVLTVRMEKAPDAKPRRISVKA